VILIIEDELIHITVLETRPYCVSKYI